VTLNGLLRIVFSKTAVLQRTTAGFRYAGRHASPFGCRRELCSVSRWGASEVAAEGRRERAHTVESNTHANVCDLAICAAKKCRCSFQAACQQVMVRRLAKCPMEFATEMGRRQAGSSGKDRNAEWLEVSTVHQSFRTEQVSGARNGDHILQYRESRRGLAAAACSSSSSPPWPGMAASAAPPRLAFSGPSVTKTSTAAPTSSKSKPTFSDSDANDVDLEGAVSRLSMEPSVTSVSWTVVENLGIALAAQEQPPSSTPG
jgi:hypothetical protein